MKATLTIPLLLHFMAAGCDTIVPTRLTAPSDMNGVWRVTSQEQGYSDCMLFENGQPTQLRTDCDFERDSDNEFTSTQPTFTGDRVVFLYEDDLGGGSSFEYRFDLIQQQDGTLVGTKMSIYHPDMLTDNVSGPFEVIFERLSY
ncbi:MAG: hypothetical protein IPK83_06940 [Planctomycetes bacterium]|nr:hypothetical protein [Planctomycetota bacterium]